MCLACSTVPSYLVYLRTGSFIIALAIGALLGFAPVAFVLFKRVQRFAKFEQCLPEALDIMVSGLRVGQSLNAAFGMVGRECPDPIGSEFRICFEEQNYGLELRNAIDNMTSRVPIRDIRIVATAILIQKESGGNLAEVLENTASVIRSRFRLKRQVKVHTAQGRMTGWVLSLLPVVLGFGIYLMNPAMMSVLWTRPLGIKLLWAAFGMWVLGTLIVQKIVRMDV
jgi:tight adherence protein B